MDGDGLLRSPGILLTVDVHSETETKPKVRSQHHVKKDSIPINTQGYNAGIIWSGSSTSQHCVYESEFL